jgi:hypothetical protein
VSHQLRYHPGASFLVAGSRVAAFTDDLKLANRLWPLIERESPLQAVLGEALRDGLVVLSDLLLIEFDGPRTRIIARGPLVATVQSSSGDVTSCTGEAVSTWTERVFDDAISLSVKSGGVNSGGVNSGSVNSGSVNSGSVATGSDHTLPIVIGVVSAGGFEWGQVITDKHWSTDDVRDAAQQHPASVITVEPVAETVQQLPAEDLAPQVPAGEPAPPEAPTRVTPLSELSIAKMLVPEPVQPDVSASASRPGLAETRTEPSDDAFGHLFGSTVMRSVEDAAVRDVVENQEPVAEQSGNVNDVPPRAGGPGRLGDHDGSTVMAAELADVRSAQQGNQIHHVPGGPPDAVLVSATGEEISLERDVVIGRRPQVDRVSGSAIPRLITVDSPDLDISRSHLQINRDRDGYTATDLHSVNGTLVIGADGSSRTLGAGNQLPLHLGDVVDLGDGVTFTLRARS